MRYIEHVGVLGMKWGHRKATSESSGGRKVNKPFGKRNMKAHIFLALAAVSTAAMLYDAANS